MNTVTEYRTVFWATVSLLHITIVQSSRYCSIAVRAKSNTKQTTPHAAMIVRDSHSLSSNFLEETDVMGSVY